MGRNFTFMHDNDPETQITAGAALSPQALEWPAQNPTSVPIPLKVFGTPSKSKVQRQHPEDVNILWEVGEEEWCDSECVKTFVANYHSRRVKTVTQAAEYSMNH